ncbi:MAG TPA: thioredoxin domain-containing protein [Polyangiaceae bacterium]
MKSPDLAGPPSDPPSKTARVVTTLGPAMFSLRLAGAALVFALFNSQLTTCRSPGEGGSEAAPAHAEAKDVTLPGVDTSALTGREKSDWSRYVSDLLAPCPDQPVSLAQCVQENRNCKQCVPAADFLVKQVRRGRARGQIEASFRGRFSADMIKNIDVEGSPAKGSTGAPVQIVEFADFECPHCAATRPILDELFKRYDGQIRFVFKNFPLGMHQYAEKAARAAMAASKQDKFWEMEVALFDNQQNLEPSNVEQLAKSIGLDMPRFLKDRDSEAVADLVSRDRKQGEHLELAATPSIFINGRQFESSGEFKEDLDDWVTLEIKLAGGNATPVVMDSAALAAPSASGVGSAKATAPPAASAKAAPKPKAGSL